MIRFDPQKEMPEGRCTSRDEYGNADINGVDMSFLLGLDYEQLCTMQQALNRLADFEDTLAESRWISCSERLPCEDGRYLVSYWLMKDMPWISVMYYGKPTFPEKDHPCFYVSDGEYGDVEYNDIVAWMPLPEPARLENV